MLCTKKNASLAGFRKCWIEFTLSNVRTGVDVSQDVVGTHDSVQEVIKGIFDDSFQLLIQCVYYSQA